MDIKTKIEEGIALISCDLLRYGDYDNSGSVERANVRYLEANNLIDQLETGAYGSVQAWLLDTPGNRELLDGLEDYPCFDDELVSQIEAEIEENYIRDNDDIFRLYTNEYMRDALDLLDRRTIDPEIYREAKEQDNAYFEVHSGGIGYINLKKLAPTYNSLLCDRYPEIKIIADLLEKTDGRSASVPVFPISFYQSARDMLNHRMVTGTTVTDHRDFEEILREILRYTAELEEVFEK